MTDISNWLFAMLLIYCTASLIMFAEKLMYFIRCSFDSNFRKKQPVLWKKATVQDMILTITFTWLPMYIIILVVDSFKN